MKNSIENTTAEVSANPVVGLLTALPGGIEASEARGQSQLVRSEVLPADCRGASRQALEAAGVVFGAPVEGDLLFVHATLPAGWQKRATGHAMWSDLLDERGRKRAGIFYKAAFYDRKAHMHVNTRYVVECEYPENGDYKTHKAHVVDGGNKIFSTDWMTDEGEKARDLAKAWLDEKRPGWENPAMYWSEP